MQSPTCYLRPTCRLLAVLMIPLAATGVRADDVVVEVTLEHAPTNPLGHGYNVAYFERGISNPLADPRMAAELACALRTRRVTNWQGGGMVLRWAAGAFLATEAGFRRLDGYRDLWMLKAALDDGKPEGKEGRVA